MSECGGACIVEGRMCEACKADPAQHAYRLTCGWCGKELLALDLMYCSRECSIQDHEAIEEHLRQERERVARERGNT